MSIEKLQLVEMHRYLGCKFRLREITKKKKTSTFCLIKANFIVKDLI